MKRSSSALSTAMIFVCTFGTEPAHPQDHMWPTPRMSEVSRTLCAWADAWSAQLPETYLEFYAPEYRPSNGISRKAWEALRRIRLTRPGFIDVAVKDLSIELVDEITAHTHFKQVYRASHFSDISYKTIVLKWCEKGWKIVAERSREGR